jgi:hypothetical protein
MVRGSNRLNSRFYTRFAYSGQPTMASTINARFEFQRAPAAPLTSFLICTPLATSPSPSTPRKVNRRGSLHCLDSVTVCQNTVPTLPHCGALATIKVHLYLLPTVRPYSIPVPPRVGTAIPPILDKYGRYMLYCPPLSEHVRQLGVNHGDSHLDKRQS